MQGLSLLLASIMAAGSVPALDARDPRLGHRALVQLDRAGSSASMAVLARFRVTVRAKPDPDVGVRVRGMTRATWDAVASGVLEAHEDGPRAWFDMPDRQRKRLMRMVDRLPAAERDCIYRVGADWASASTSRKNRATAAASTSRNLVSFA